MTHPLHAQTMNVTEPVKIVLERRVRPGAQDSFEAWVRELLEAAGRSPGHQGSSVLTANGRDYFILLRFGSRAALDDWQTSLGVPELLRKGRALATEVDGPEVRTGLETWFMLPGERDPRSAPPRWKMAVVTWAMLLPQVLLLGALVPVSMPPVLAAAVSTAIPVALLTWVIMPAVTRALYGWLYARDQT